MPTRLGVPVLNPELGTRLVPPQGPREPRVSPSTLRGVPAPAGSDGCGAAAASALGTTPSCRFAVAELT